MTTSRVLLYLAVLPALVIGSSCSHAQKEADAEVAAKRKTERHGFLGVSLQDMSPERARDMKVKTETGALVNSVEDESPAEAAGIKDDDIVVEFNGKAIEDANDLVHAVRKTTPGETASIVVVRKDEKKTLQAKLGKAPAELDLGALSLVRPHVPAAPTPKLRVFTHMESGVYGLELMTLNKQLGEYFGAPDKKGVLVESVEKKSAAEKAGFKAGDVIVKVGQDRIVDTRDMREALGEFKEGEKVSVEILRKGSRNTLTLTAEEQDMGTFFQGHSGPWKIDEEQLNLYKKDEFKGQMEKMRQELKSMTKKLREETRAIQSKVEREVRDLVGS